MQLSILETKRDEKRERLHNLFEQQKLIQDQMRQVEVELEKLDGSIDEIEAKILNNANKSTTDTAKAQPVFAVKKEYDRGVAATGKQQERRSQTQADEFLTDPTISPPMTTHNDKNSSAMSFVGFDYYHRPPPSRTGSSSTTGVLGQLEMVEAPEPRRKQQPSEQMQQAGEHPSQESSFMRNHPGLNRDNHDKAPQASAASNDPDRRPHVGTLDTHFVLPSNQSTTTIQLNNDLVRNPYNAASVAIPPPYQIHNSNGDSDNNNHFPWSAQVNHLLQNTFRIPSFRDHQREIINSTMSGHDVFVIMRTGGGKSLTYQLPALFEGRGPQRKVTFVISPLLSLIQDQVDQMNLFAPGSALSFTSGIAGGAAEHNHRWARVQDPAQQVCLVFVTPEKVSKSGRLCSEMEKLFAQGRLGRFVIDECHCACQWGHDFRPDYVKLGKLKAHFPSIPLIAVTATASDRVKEDVCRILQIGTNYLFFRSTANRPNLTYSVRQKPDGKGAVVSVMAEFIKEKHPGSAGIVYTLSKKDAESVAAQLCDYGVVSRAYHSDVSPARKEQIHKSWMCNATQVVVATIAFGLGINKPDVSFVLHHSLSKTLEAYYQESGRAGRDGRPADCVLFYSPKVSMFREFSVVAEYAHPGLLFYCRTSFEC
jgi:RecQ family ATP-dependent DNA helicase